MVTWIVFLIIGTIIVTAILYKRPAKNVTLPPGYQKLLSENVAFYRNINDEGKTRFENKVKEFLGYVNIDGVGTNVDDLDRLLEWKYYNLREVLLYPGTFNKDEFLTSAEERNTLGMVGNGPMQRVMILSKPALYEGFVNDSGKQNTGIHEFVHLLDKEDGAVDGMPEALLQKQYAVPWLQLINKNITAILEASSDINVYGATNKAEFFAVAAEYFFERPDLFKEKHPELYQLMTQIFHQEPPE